MVQIKCFGAINNDLLDYFRHEVKSVSGPFEIIIDSPGGSVASLEEIKKIIAAHNGAVLGRVIGLAYSAAFDLLQECKTRTAARHSTLMFHAPRLGGGYYVLIEDPCYLALLEVLARRSGQSMADLVSYGNSGRVFSAEEALRLGFLDHIYDE
ncbi:MAG: ATP-dependent Clp protease proteolytic subunit [bacterium]|nr:ATP-dependent Clp protease proteolytic subunit [bacterium]